MGRAHTRAQCARARAFGRSTVAVLIYVLFDKKNQIKSITINNNN